MKVLLISLVLILSSCGLFQANKTLQNEDAIKLLKAIKLTGEGKGRLTIGQNKYVFGVDSILNEKNDWIMAVAIPLHGEEVMILKDLKKNQLSDDLIDSFEIRISSEFKHNKITKSLSPKKFLKGLRSIIRFKQAEMLGLKRNCEVRQNQWVCDLDGEEFFVQTENHELKVAILVSEDQKIQITGKFLEENEFKQIEIKLLPAVSVKDNQPTVFSLELFW